MSFRDWITHCADILSGEVDGNVTGHEEVHGIDDTKDEFSALFDGHTEKSFEK